MLLLLFIDTRGSYLCSRATLTGERGGPAIFLRPPLVHQLFFVTLSNILVGQSYDAVTKRLCFYQFEVDFLLE